MNAITIRRTGSSYVARHASGSWTATNSDLVQLVRSCFRDYPMANIVAKVAGKRVRISCVNDVKGLS